MISPDQLEEALLLNRKLASKGGPAYADELESAGLFTIGKLISRFDPRRGSSFAGYCRAWLMKEHRAALINCMCGYDVPYAIAGYNERLGDRRKTSLDTMAHHLAAPEVSELPDYEYIHDALKQLTERQREAIYSRFFDRRTDRFKELRGPLTALRRVLQGTYKPSSPVKATVEQLRSLLADHPEGLTAQEAANLSGLHVKKVYRCLAAGEFKRKRHRWSIS